MNDLVSVLRRILATFAVGLGGLSIVVGFVTIDGPDGCGSLFAHDSACDGTNNRLIVFLVLLGLSITCAVAAVRAKARPLLDETSGPTSDTGSRRRGRLGDEQARRRAHEESQRQA